MKLKNIKVVSLDWSGTLNDIFKKIWLMTNGVLKFFEKRPMSARDFRKKLESTKPNLY